MEISILIQQIIGGCVTLAIIVILIYLSFDFVKNKKRWHQHKLELRVKVKEITNCRFIQLDGGKMGENYPYEY